MKRKMKLDLVAQGTGLSGAREVVRKTIRVSGKECRRMRNGKWNRPVSSEEERLAALYLMWEEGRTEEYGEERRL